MSRLPCLALATVLMSYESAFGFERLARRYAETCSALALADVFGPRPEDLDQLETDAKRDEAVLTFVTDTERLLRSEVDSWSQQTAGAEDWLPDELVTATRDIRPSGLAWRQGDTRVISPTNPPCRK